MSVGSRGDMGGQSGVRLASSTCSKARDQTTQDHLTLVGSDGLLILDHCWAFTRGLTRDFTRGFARGFTHDFTRDLASDLCLCSCLCLCLCLCLCGTVSCRAVSCGIVSCGIVSLP